MRLPKWDKKHVYRIVTSTALVVILAVAATMTLGFFIQTQRVDGLRSTLTVTRASDAAHDKEIYDSYKTVYEQLQAEGKTPTTLSPAEVKALQGAAGATGSAGAAGPAGAAGVSIVGASCTGSGLEMFYSDGSSSNAGDCQGMVGKTGQAGATGAPGATGAAGASVVGPAGPAGPAGTDGKDGTDGTNGTSVTGVSCVVESDGFTTAFEFAFSDGTTTDVAGPCTPPSSNPTGDTP